jgi:DNA replication protein DnaC
MKKRCLEDILESINNLQKKNRNVANENKTISKDPPGVRSRSLSSYVVQKNKLGQKSFVIQEKCLEAYSCPFCQPLRKPLKSKSCLCFQYEQILHMLNRANIPNRYKHDALNQDHFFQKHFSKGSEARFKKIQEFLEQLKDNQKASKTFLMLYGSYGSGKTFLACYLLKVLIVHFSLRSEYIDYGEILLKSYSDFKTKNYLVESLSNVDVLLIDDLGKDSFVNIEKSDVFDLILTNRYNEKKITIFTSNYHPDGLYSPLNFDEEEAPVVYEQLGNRLGRRLFSRILEEMIFLDFSGISDIRKQIFRNHLKQDSPSS